MHFWCQCPFFDKSSSRKLKLKIALRLTAFAAKTRTFQVSRRGWAAPCECHGTEAAVCIGGQAIPPAPSNTQHLQSLHTVHTASVSRENLKKLDKKCGGGGGCGGGPALDKWVYCCADGWRLTRTGVRRLTWRNTAVITTHPPRHHVDQSDRWALQLS